MAAKNVVQCMDAMEELVAVVQAEFQIEMGTLEEELQNMTKDLNNSSHCRGYSSAWCIFFSGE